MTITIFSTHTFEMIVEASDVEEYNVFLSENNWILGIDYFDEEAEQDKQDTMILCPATSEDAYDDILIIKSGSSGEPVELFASDKIVNELNADNDLMTALCVYLSKRKLSKSELKYAAGEI